MQLMRRNMLYGLFALAGTGRNLNRLHAHHHALGMGTGSAQVSPPPADSKANRVPGAGGQGRMKFSVLYTSDHLPPEARKVLVNAHGGFAVDRRPGKRRRILRFPELVSFKSVPI